MTEEEQAWVDSVDEANALMRQAAAVLPWGETEHPVGRVQWIHIDQVQANDYNPNSVAHQEMKLLHTSIASDGYTQPVVAIWDPDAQKPPCDCGEITEHLATCAVVIRPAGRYIIVDGFHRYTTMRRYPDIYESTHGFLPVVVLHKDVADRIASTVRHNRARGKHSVAGMANLVFQMLMAGETDDTICNKIGLEPEELARLKHVTGYSRLYDEQEYGALALTKTQVEEKAAYAKAHPDETVPVF